MHTTNYDKSIIIETPSGSSIAMENIIYAIAREAKQPGLAKNTKLLIRLSSDIFLDTRAWNDVLEKVIGALQNYDKTRELSLSAFRKIALVAFITDVGQECSATIWA